jgi:hypothetical protein
MRLAHPDHPSLGLRLGYGANVHPSLDADGVLAGLRALALPLRARLAPATAEFGVGAWLPAKAAREFRADERRFAALLELCHAGALDLFTFNAFPHGAFHGPGLKQRVFEPSWKDPARLAFTLDVAELAVRLRRARGGSPSGAHLSISTHAGMFAPDLRPGDLEAVARGYLAAARALARLETEHGERVVLALEPEPRSSANDTRELARVFAAVRALARGPDEACVARHLGACLDACHAAVEFELAAEAFARATTLGPLGKLQFSSALALARPDDDAAGRARLFALDEPVYLHQVTARRGAERLAALDLGELAAAPARWRGCDEWRCHFHVPVDLGAMDGAGGLRTTRREAEEALDAALAAPERWGTQELHVEVETYTWSLLAPGSEGAATRLAGLARELEHVLARLAAAGWRPAPAR